MILTKSTKPRTKEQALFLLEERANNLVKELAVDTYVLTTTTYELEPDRTEPVIRFKMKSIGGKTPFTAKQLYVDEKTKADIQAKCTLARISTVTLEKTRYIWGTVNKYTVQMTDKTHIFFIALDIEKENEKRITVAIGVENYKEIKKKYCRAYKYKSLSAYY